MARLFCYIIPIDDGAAPNPFRGMCSLAICKPAIRRVAKVGDWVAGLGSKRAPSGDLSGRLVYAMKVERVLTLKQYDQEAPLEWPDRIPDFRSANSAERLGDCIYDYSSGEAVQRPGVHDGSNRKADLNGLNVLISWDYYYFGRAARLLPDSLRPIICRTQGHRSNSNAPYLKPFEAWLRGLNLTPGQMYGSPDFELNWEAGSPHRRCVVRKPEAVRDAACS